MLIRITDHERIKLAIVIILMFCYDSDDGHSTAISDVNDSIIMITKMIRKRGIRRRRGRGRRRRRKI